MKNMLIVVLLVVAGTMGVALLTKEDSKTSNLTSSTDASQTQENQNTPANSGKTLNYASKGLSEVPKNILDDKSVTTLDVSGNNLTGALPAEIRKLSNLEVLNASNNNMTGIPAEIGQLSKLKVANFANNDLSGLPLEIGNLSNLQTLDLRGNPNISKLDLSKIQPKIPNATILVD